MTIIMHKAAVQARARIICGAADPMARRGWEEEDLASFAWTSEFDI